MRHHDHAHGEAALVDPHTQFLASLVLPRASMRKASLSRKEDRGVRFVRVSDHDVQIVSESLDVHAPMIASAYI
jgi:hypothetical protein